MRSIAVLGLALTCPACLTARTDARIRPGVSGGVTATLMRTPDAVTAAATWASRSGDAAAPSASATATRPRSRSIAWTPAIAGCANARSASIAWAWWALAPASRGTSIQCAALTTAAVR